jgi:hypothetical protein
MPVYGDDRGLTGGSVGSPMKDKKEGRSLHEKGIFQILELWILEIYAVELSLL